MVHALRFLKCKRGHKIGIGYDSNECGCHHDGKPCLVINCKGCFEENLKTAKNSDELYSDIESIYIPLDDEGKKIVEDLLSQSKNRKKNG